MNKNFIIPDYSKVEKIFLVSPIDTRGEEYFEEFYKLILLISQVINHKIDLVIVCNDEKAEAKTRVLMQDYEKEFGSICSILNIEYFLVRVIDVWIRDYFACGNIKTPSGERSCLKAVYAPSYNSYYPHVDDAAGVKLAQKYFDNFLSYSLPFKLDGGNVIANDEVIFISEKLYTENIVLSKPVLDNFFQEHFEQKLITLPCEILDSIGHTDSIVRFLNPRTICLPIYEEEFRADNRYIMNIRNKITEQLGLDYKVIFLPSYLSDKINDDNIFSAEGLFINFIRIENNIIFPSFKGLEDYQKEITKILSKEVPELKIHFSPCDKYASEGGCFNCISNFVYSV